MSLFRIVKYSSIIYFLGKHRGKLFRSLAVLLFAVVTSLLYEDLRVYLASQHPDSLIYALVAKVVIVYGSLAFVLLQFRPGNLREKRGEERAAAVAAKAPPEDAKPADRLAALEDIEHHDRLRSRYDRILAGEAHADGSTSKPAKRP